MRRMLLALAAVLLATGAGFTGRVIAGGHANGAGPVSSPRAQAVPAYLKLVPMEPSIRQISFLRSLHGATLIPRLPSGESKLRSANTRAKSRPGRMAKKWSLRQSTPSWWAMYRPL